MTTIFPGPACGFDSETGRAAAAATSMPRLVAEEEGSRQGPVRGKRKMANKSFWMSSRSMDWSIVAFWSWPVGCVGATLEPTDYAVVRSGDKLAPCFPRRLSQDVPERDRLVRTAADHLRDRLLHTHPRPLINRRTTTHRSHQETCVLQPRSMLSARGQRESGVCPWGSNVALVAETKDE